MNIFMKRAIDLAVQNVLEGGQPFGAVLVKENQIVAEGVNELHVKHDISGHAELLAIRRAQDKLKTIDLSGYTMYASGEPCPMCLSAMYFSGIKQVFYCQSVEDAAEIGLVKSEEIYKDLKEEKANRSVNISQIPLEITQENPMKLWKEKI